MSDVTQTSFLEVAEAVAKEVGAYQKEKQASALKIEYKGEINPVTEVDKKSEEIIIQKISAVFPDHDILAEEGSGRRKDSPYKWIVDPLDGTVNYSHGYPYFAPSIALEFEGRIIAGVVYDPMRDELFEAFEGAGARLNGKPIHVSECQDLNRALIATGFAYNCRQTIDEDLALFKNAILNAQGVRRDGVAALDLCYVACGRYDGFYEANLWPWDTAAGLVIVKEAGGDASIFNGSPYTVYDKEIVITNGKIHKEVIHKITKG